MDEGIKILRSIKKMMNHGDDDGGHNDARRKKIGTYIMGSVAGIPFALITLLLLFMYNTYGRQAKYLLSRWIDKYFQLPTGVSNRLMNNIFQEEPLIEITQENRELVYLYIIGAIVGPLFAILTLVADSAYDTYGDQAKFLLTRYLNKYFQIPEEMTTKLIESPIELSAIENSSANQTEPIIRFRPTVRINRRPRPSRLDNNEKIK